MMFIKPLSLTNATSPFWQTPLSCNGFNKPSYFHSSHTSACVIPIISLRWFLWMRNLSNSEDWKDVRSERSHFLLRWDGTMRTWQNGSLNAIFVFGSLSLPQLLHTQIPKMRFWQSWNKGSFVVALGPLHKRFWGERFNINIPKRNLTVCRMNEDKFGCDGIRTWWSRKKDTIQTDVKTDNHSLHYACRRMYNNS